MIQVHSRETKAELGRAAARLGADAIRAAIAEKGFANIVVATGASQFDTLAALVEEDIDWSRVSAFHLDEYIGIPEAHPASFRLYLKDRLVSRLPTLRSFFYLAGDADDLAAEISRANAEIAKHPIDVTFAGIGENGHLAFNDPPADFDAKAAFQIVELDERCRQQQFGEGWFPSLADVPARAITMTVPQIVSSKLIVLTVPDARKAEAVQRTLEGPVMPDCPASILQRHAATHLFLDPPAASLLGAKGR
jgi:glucosamine-6-phosphate deaminase